MLNLLAPAPFAPTPFPATPGLSLAPTPLLAPAPLAGAAPLLDPALGMWSDPTSSLIMGQLLQLLGALMPPQPLGMGMADPFGMGMGGGMGALGGGGGFSGGGGGGAISGGGGGGGSSYSGGGGAAPVSTSSSSGGTSSTSSSGGATEIPPVSLAGDDKALAQFIEGELKGSPAGGQGLGEQFVAAGRKYDVDPLALLAIGKHETGYGSLGVGIEKMLGVGAYDSNPDGATPFDGAVQQIWSGAKTFDNLRAKGGADSQDSLADQLSAVNKAGWATDDNWHNGVGSHYNEIARHAKEAAPKTDKAASKPPKEDKPPASAPKPKAA